MTAPLVRAQSARFAALDPLLPAAVDPPPGEVITAALADGERVAGVITKTSADPGTPQTLWSAAQVWELHPLVGAAGGPGVDALLRRWPSIVARVSPGRDSACVVTWPSRDVEATAALLAHGFVPLAVLAVRTGGARPGGEPAGAVVRRATAADLDALVVSAMAEVAYSSLVGGAVLRPGAANIKRETLRRHLAQGDPVWIAEVDGVPVGHVEGWHTSSTPGSWAETRVKHGRWGYVNCLSVLPSARGTGVGRALMDVAHAALLGPGTVGSFLYYNPPNPVSPVFWARQGYRPLWTVWETRPAGAVR
ncbi:GNAT family N-acetyltransferase [Actinokineospora diospyrosa]|uniref:Acetyltransferase (GNAT) family protein n=1 Tax=Actinokineospora diospyrosa TaxID=103728 RepID=A0ABT1I6F5_9PSEU|nr:GNAT family N-acetyltransferase [Actinokineospora diospyrosa]MCP2268205.1 Acetyltransferase (GNAT) family protein [Actinokineospora diospyrosa]